MTHFSMIFVINLFVTKKTLMGVFYLLAVLFKRRCVMSHALSGKVRMENMPELREPEGHSVLGELFNSIRPWLLRKC